jgi:alginate O-acetyltransferase complex protein AlgI
MFPQLIAGPILRFHTVADQLKQRLVTAKNVYDGVTLFCFGLGQKVLLADTMAGIVDPLFARWEEMSPAASWLAAVAYAFQIYYDFAGYSNMAIGLGWITGFTFPKNFNFPYVSRSITEFWQRWHMSLSRWFRDYLYIPLGGNRFGAMHTYRNLFIVFLLCGLWHGAAWTFVLWGCYQGLLLIIERIGFGRLLRRLPVGVQHLYALVAILIGWVLFRSVGLQQARSILARMFFLRSGPDGGLIAQIFGREQMVGLAFAILFASPVVPHLLRRWVARPDENGWPRKLPLLTYANGGLCAGFIFTASAVKILTGAYSPFIYFRF